MIEALGAKAIDSSLALYELVSLVGQTLRACWRQTLELRFRYGETRDQFFSIAAQSVPMVVFSIGFVSLMLTVEFSFHMKLVLQQDSLVPAFSTLLVLRELGPVITSLLLTSRVGASIAAEVGSMRITDQIDALRLLAIDPVEYIVLPRWGACVFACCALSLLAVAVSILAGAALGGIYLGYGYEQYFNTMFLFARSADLWNMLIKCTVFGTIIPLVSCYHGFRCDFGAQGVGTATTSAVVNSTMAIILSDFILTYLLYAL